MFRLSIGRTRTILLWYPFFSAGASLFLPACQPAADTGDTSPPPESPTTLSAGENGEGMVIDLPVTATGLPSVFQHRGARADADWSQEAALRVIETISDTEREMLQAAQADLASATAPDAAIAALQKLQGINAIEVFPVIAQGYTHPDPQVRLEAITLLDRFSAPEANLLRLQALKDASEDVRLASLDTLGEFQSEPAQSTLVAALNNDMEEVRQVACDLIEDADPSTRLRLRTQSLRSAYADVVQRGLIDVQFSGLRSDMPEVIRLMDSPNAEVSELANTVVFSLVGEDFENSSSASEWWKQNRHRFSDDFAELVPP